MRFLQLRKAFVLIGCFVVLPLIWMILFSDSDLSENSLLEQRVVEMRDRLHYAESLNQDCQQDIRVLRDQIKTLLKAQADTPGNGSLSNSMSVLKDAQNLLANLSQSTSDISTPGIYNYLPHLLGRPGALKPGFKISRGRVGASIVMGVPTIKRLRESYLVQTLESLLTNLNSEEKEDALIIVFVAEPNDLDYVKAVASEVETRFKEHLNTGLLEVIAPPADFYPNLDNLQETFGDSLERVKWRTKQNLDFSYLMMYARNKGTYYVQLEDDLLTKPGYHSMMKTFALNQKTDDWILLEYSYLGFIGKLFKSRDLPLVVEFFLMFHRDKPIDWLLDHLLYVKVCNPEKDRKHCQRSINELRRRFKPSLFQHIGTHSSLTGKIQKLKDKDFGKTMRVASHLNPNAEVSTTLKIYQHFSLDRAYMGETFFWGLIPEAGDIITFKFNPPITIEKYMFRSGNPEHPGDKMFNTTVEILPADSVAKQDGVLMNLADVAVGQGPELSPDGFIVINKFDHMTGIAGGTLSEDYGAIDTIRLRTLTQGSSWVILSEIMISPRRT